MSVRVYLLVCCALICSSNALALSSALSRGSPACSAIVDSNSSHFTVTVRGKALKVQAHMFDVLVKNEIGDFRVRLCDVPGVVIADRKITAVLFAPSTGVSDVIVAFEGKSMFETKVRVNSLVGDGRYTRLLCVGSSYRSRWCYARNVCVDRQKLYFVLPYEARFEDVFLVPGSRAPPNDPQEFRITKERIVVMPELSDEFENVTGVIGSRFYNSRMLWHCAMDSLAPTFWTMTSFSSNVTDSEWGHEENEAYGMAIDRTSELVVFDNFGSTALFYLRALTKRPPLLIGSRRRCYRTAILGLRKTSANAEFQDERSLMVRYDIDPQGVRGLRGVMLEWAGLNKCVPSKSNPLVMIINRRTNEEKRRILNFDELINSTKEMCPICNVTAIDLQDYDKQGQVRVVCGASALIGAHGSGLTHVAWMNPSSAEFPTTLIELFPYKYTCRNWYEREANMARVGYIAVHTLNINQSRWASWHNEEKVARCHTLEGECERGRCHDFLRDQSIIVDISQYRSLTKPFFDQLRA